MCGSSSTEIFRLALQQLEEGVILTDPEGTITFVNNAAERSETSKRKISSAATFSAAIGPSRGRKWPRCRIFENEQK
jgi:nitrogen-specific signal transduction histidine kinase